MAFFQSLKQKLHSTKERPSQLTHVQFDALEKVTSSGCIISFIDQQTTHFSSGLNQLLARGQHENLNDLTDYYTFIHPDDLDHVKKAHQKMTQGEQLCLTYRLNTSAGEKTIVEEAVHFYDDQYTLTKVIQIMQDVTEFEETKASLLAIEEAQAHTQRIAGIGNWTYDVLNDFFYASDEVYHMFNVDHSVERLDFLSLLSLIHPDDQMIVKEAMDKHLLGKEATIEFRIPEADALMKYIETTAGPIIDENGTVIKVVGVIHDVTTRKNIEQELIQNNRLLSHIQHLTKIGSWELDFTLNKAYHSKEALDIFGVNPETFEHSFDAFKQLMHPDDRHLLDRYFNDPPKQPFDLAFRIIRPDQNIRYIEERIEFCFDDVGDVTGVFGTIKDVTDITTLETELDLTHKRYQALVRKAHEVFEIITPETDILYISDAVYDVIGYTPEECIGLKLYDFHQNMNITVIKAMIEEVMASPTTIVTKDLPFKTKQGVQVHLEVRMQNLLTDPAIGGIVLTFKDVTERVKTEHQLRHLSRYSLITKLPNRIYFEDYVDELLTDKRAFGVVMIDILSARYIKDTLGFKVMEDYMIKIASKLNHHVHEPTFLAHYADDCFSLLIKDASKQSDIETIIEGLFNLFIEPITIKHYQLDVDLVMGISLTDGHIQTRKELIRFAETALYLARNEGKNTVKFYSEDINIPSFKNFSLRNDLKKAIKNNELRVYYHPIVHLSQYDIIAAESLIRWEHPEWGIVPPLEFITLAEETGDIIDIGDWLFDDVCKNYRAWLDDQLLPIKISVNVSIMQLLDSNFTGKIMATINRYQLDPSFLIIEITESMLMQHSDKIRRDIDELRAFGIQIALDDFGTGYSSLAYLDTLPIDILKIDGAFIKKINKSHASTVITRQIIELAKALEIKVFAEYIETFDQLNFLQEERCFSGQGYLFSKPLPAADFVDVLKSKKCYPQSTNSDQPFKDRRKYFRVNFNDYLEGDLTIVKIKNREVNVGNTRVLIKNIGPGGLAFISNIVLPVENNLVLAFQTTLLDEAIEVHGHPVWTREVADGLFEYGLSFTITEAKRDDLTKLLNDVQVQMKKDILFADGRFISTQPQLYFSPI